MFSSEEEKGMKKIFIALLLIILAFLSIIIVGCSSKEIEIEYDVNGGIVEVVSVSVQREKKYFLHVPYRENSKFLGWFDSLSEEARQITDENGMSLEAFNEERKITVYAKWYVYESNNLLYELSMDGQSYIAYANNSLKEEKYVRIPETYLGKEVKSIGNYAFYNKNDLKEVYLPDTIELIGHEAFYECKSLYKVSFSESLKTIGEKAFSKCSLLFIEKLPNSIEIISISAFSACTSIIKMDFSENNNLTVINDYAFSGCIGLNEVILPKNLKNINIGVFANCSGLRDVNVIDEIESIDDFAFSGCSSLLNLNIGKGLRLIGFKAFSGCPLLNKINVVEDNLAFLSENNILYSKDKEELIRVSPTYSGNFEVDSNVKIISSYAFDDCKDILLLKIGPQVIEIFEAGLAGMNYLQSLEMPFIGGSRVENTYMAFIFGGQELSNVTNIPSTLKKVKISEGLTIISQGAFQHCRMIEEIELPNSIEFIGDYAFYGCTNINKFILPENITFIGEFAFYVCNSLTEFSLSDINNNYSVIDGVLYNKNETILIQYPAQKIGNDFIIPDTVTKIEDGAFYANQYIVSINTSNVSNIGDYAFSFARSMNDIVLNNSLLVIGKQAFSNLRSLVEITFPEQLNDLGDQAFYNNLKLEKVVFNGNCPNKIGNAIFRDCTNESLTIFVRAEFENNFLNKEALSIYSDLISIIIQ